MLLTLWISFLKNFPDVTLLSCRYDLVPARQPDSCTHYLLHNGRLTFGIEPPINYCVHKSHIIGRLNWYKVCTHFHNHIMTLTSALHLKLHELLRESRYRPTLLVILRWKIERILVKCLYIVWRKWAGWDWGIPCYDITARDRCYK